MKYRNLAVAILLIVALIGVVPAFAQDAAATTPTIADLVVASTTADTPEFTTLLAAVQAADPAVLDLLSSADANVTVFAPTDAAFAAALSTLNLSAEDLLANKTLLTDILLYHVVPGAFRAEAIGALDGAMLGTMLPEQALTIAAGDSGVTINDASVVTADIQASNGVIHVIDAVLMPSLGENMGESADGGSGDAPTRNIAETVIAATGGDTPEFTTLLAAVQATDPAILGLLTGTGPYTVFAPTDAAFSALLAGLNITFDDLKSNKELLTMVLAYHIVPGEFSSDTAIAAAGMEGGVRLATALNGTTVHLTLDGESLKVDDATVVTPNLYATNGVIHIIDGVLLPPTES